MVGLHLCFDVLNESEGKERFLCLSVSGVNAAFKR